MKILLTGRDGFVGSNIDADVKLSRADADLLSWQSTLAAILQHRPDVVIHCAAYHGNYHSMNTDKVGHFCDNLQMDMNLFLACHQAGVQKLLAFSSITAFPGQLTAPLTEDDLDAGPPHSSCFGYAYAKRMTSVLCDTYRQQFGRDYICLLPANIYGPNCDIHAGTRTVVSEVINRILRCGHATSDVVMDGDGSALRDFIFVKDINQIVHRIINGFDDSAFPSSRGRIILSTGQHTSIRQLTETVAQLIGHNGHIQWRGGSLGQSVKITDNSKLMSIYPDLKFTSLEAGLQQTIDYIEKEICLGLGIL